MTTETNVPAQASDEPMPCPECSNEYLAIRNDIHKDGRAFVYCDVCGCMAPKSVWNRIGPRATADVDRDAARYRWLREHVVSLVRTRAEKDRELREQEWIDWEASADAHIAAAKGAKPNEPRS